MDAKNTLIELIENRLDYFLSKCNAQEYDTQEVSMLIESLRIIKKEEIAVSSSHIALHSPKTKSHIHKILIPPVSSPNKANIAAVMGIAAACIISIVLIGVNAPINAGPDTGFFFWLNKDNEGMTMITDPETTDIPCEDCECCSKCSCGCTSATE